MKTNKSQSIAVQFAGIVLAGLLCSPLAHAEGASAVLADAPANTSAGCNWTTRSGQPARLVDPTSVAKSLTDRSAGYRATGKPINEKINVRVGIAEEIGEDGGQAYAERMGYRPLLIKSQKVLRQGPDQVYEDGEWVVVIEAKGGTSALGNAYGAEQGTPKWAVRTARATLASDKASEAEIQASKRILDAAARGKLRVEVVRTAHVQGTPKLTTLESVDPDVTQETATEARQVLRKIARVSERDATKTLSKSPDGLARGTRTVPEGSKTARGFRIGCGALQAIGGAVQTAQGIREIRNGQTVDGSFDVGSGAANGTGAALLIAGKVAAGATVGGVATVADGAHDIYVGVRDGDGKKTGVGSAKVIAGGLMITGAATANPALVTTGAIVYGGIIIYENWDPICNLAGQGAAATGRFCAESAHVVEDWLPHGAR